MEITGKQIIGFEQKSSGETIFNALNPAIGAKIKPDFFEASKDELNEAILKANSAFEIYKKFEPVKRAAFIREIGKQIMNLGDLLLERCEKETALAKSRLENERTRTVNQLNLFADVVEEGSWINARIDTALPEKKPQPRADMRRMMVPLGPVAVFGASNFPFAFSVAGGDTVSAFAAGCPVVYKAHPYHPGTSELMAHAIIAAAKETGMPDGIFSMIQSKTYKTGIRLVQHAGIKAVGFTGSFYGGKSLFDAANARQEPIPVYAEMGSINPVFLFPEALKQNMDEIIDGLTHSVNLGNGQFCTNPGIFFVLNTPETDEFLDHLTEKFSYIESGIMLNENVAISYDRSVNETLKDGHIEILAKGSKKNEWAASYSLLLHANGKTFLESDILQDELFGPATIAVVVESLDEMIQCAQKLRGQLTCSVFAIENENSAQILDVLQEKCGRLIMNEFPTGVEVCHAMNHGGPFPASTNIKSTSVGSAAIQRFARPICYQNFHKDLLPEELKDDNSMKIWRMINGDFSKENL